MKLVAVPTWNCPNQCSYCDYECHPAIDGQYLLKAFNKTFEGTERSVADWIAALSKVGGGHLEITGGEPILYKGWAELTKWLASSDQWVWALTTSACSLAALESTDWSACISVTASYHYRFTDRFLENIRFIKSMGKDIRCTLVATPTNIETQVLPAIEMLSSEGLECNIHPLLKMDNKWSPADWAKVQAINANVIRDIPPEWPIRRVFPKCNAGVDYCFVDADLQVYRCYSNWLYGVSIGVLGEAVPPEPGTPCGIPCCFPCDVQFAETCQ